MEGIGGELGECFSHPSTFPRVVHQLEAKTVAFGPAKGWRVIAWRLDHGEGADTGWKISNPKRWYSLFLAYPGMMTPNIATLNIGIFLACALDFGSLERGLRG